MSASSTVLQQAALSVSAYSRIKPWLSPTPCIPSRQVLTEKTELYYKADNFQKTGSFKFCTILMVSPMIFSIRLCRRAPTRILTPAPPHRRQPKNIEHPYE